MLLGKLTSENKIFTNQQSFYFALKEKHKLKRGKHLIAQSLNFAKPTEVGHVLVS